MAITQKSIKNYVKEYEASYSRTTAFSCKMEQRTDICYEGVLVNDHGIFFWDDENVLELNNGDSCTVL